MTDIRSAQRPKPDDIISSIADYALESTQFSENTYNTAKYCLIDSIGCALLALNYPACNKLLGPIVPGASLTHGAKIVGTKHQLEPVQAAFNLGTMIRWLDYNDTWLAAEWGHPSDNFGAILALADYLNRTNDDSQKQITLETVLTYAIKAYEIQGILALENSFNRVGLDHVILVRIASTAVATAMLGGNKQQIVNAISNAWIDGGALRTYRHAPNTGSRKSWAAGDATSRAVRLAFMSMTDEMGYPSALSAKQWGFYDVLFKKQPFLLAQNFDSYVMDNILFKISFPAEFHAQTAVEAAISLHTDVKDKLDDIERIEIFTQEAAMRIIDKTGILANPADRDHCLQYMIAIPLITGQLKAEDYEDKTATEPRIDQLRDKMAVFEKPAYSKDYLDPNKRAIPNSIQVFFKDGSQTEIAEVYYPLGHNRRREESIPFLRNKFRSNLQTRFSEEKSNYIIDEIESQYSQADVNICDFIDLFSLDDNEN